MRSLPAPPSPLQPPRFGAGPSDALPLLGSPPLPPVPSLAFREETQHWESRQEEGRGCPGGLEQEGAAAEGARTGVGGAKDGTKLHPLAFGILPKLEL